MLDRISSGAMQAYITLQGYLFGRLSLRCLDWSKRRSLDLFTVRNVSWDCLAILNHPPPPPPGYCFLTPKVLRGGGLGIKGQYYGIFHSNNCNTAVNLNVGLSA